MTDADKEDGIELHGYDEDNERFKGVLDTIKNDPDALEELANAVKDVNEAYTYILEERKKLDELREKGECSEEEYNTQLQRMIITGYQSEVAERETEVRLLTNELVRIKKLSGIKTYPNDPCPCGSGRKYKKCCGKGK